MPPTLIKAVSCDKCRSLKVKCVRAETQASCSKCEKSGHQCTTSERPRDRGPRVYKERIQLRDLAVRLDGVLDNLSRQDQDKTLLVRSCEDEPCQRDVRAMTDVVAQAHAETQNIKTHKDDHDGVPANSILYGSWAGRLGLDHWLAHHLLRRYRTMQHLFPYVVVPESLDVTYMLSNRPILLLAIVSSAACHYPQLQQVLVKDLRDTLTRRVMVGGENSMELLQAMLIHLAWFQFQLVPRSQLVYRYLQVAIAMSVDLRLDRNHEAALCSDIAPSDHSAGGALNPLREADRAFLGCFHLSSVISSSLIRPNTVSYGNEALTKAARLSRSIEVASDLTIMPLIQYQRIIDEVLEAYRGDWESKDLSRLAMHPKHMVTTLQSWWVALPQYLHSTSLWETRYHYAKIRIYEMGLLFHFRIRDEAVFSATSSPALVANLLACVDAIKAYLDTLLSTEDVQLDSLPCEEWNRLIVAFFVLYKLCAGPREVSDWDVGLPRNTIDLEHYLETVADRVSIAGYTLESSTNKSEGLFFVLPDILRSAKASFAAVRDTPHLVRPGDRVHMDLSKERIVEEIARPKDQRRCPATAFWTDRALVLDQEIDWHGVDINRVLDPVKQLASTESLWKELLGGLQSDGCDRT